MGSHEHTPSVDSSQVRWDKVREARRKVAQGLDQDEHALRVTVDRLIMQELTRRHREAICARWEEGLYE